MSSISSVRGALVTGAAAGIGAGIVKRLARDGRSVMMFDQNPDVVQIAAALSAQLNLPEGRLVGRVGSVAVEQDVERAVDDAIEQFAGFDLVVANAGVGSDEVDLVDFSPDEFDRVVSVNLRGVFLTCRAGARVLREAGHGSIVTVGSIFGWQPHPRAAPYSATKAGIHALTQALALELAPYQVRVNCVAPGFVDTEGLRRVMQSRVALSGLTFDEELGRVNELVPLGRHAQPSDIAAAVAFLASDDAAYITGQTLGVTGGVVVR